MKATVKYYVRNEVRKDGLSPLFASIYAGGNRTRTAALLYCRRDRFDVERQAFKPSARVLMGSAELPAKEANLKLLQAAVEVARLASERREAPCSGELTEVLAEAFRTPSRRTGKDLTEIADALIAEYRQEGKAFMMYQTLRDDLATYADYVRGAQTPDNFDARRFLQFKANAAEIEKKTGIFGKNGRRAPRSSTQGGLLTVSRFLGTLSSWAVKRGMASRDFMDGVETPRAVERDPICLLPGEVERLQAAELPESLRGARDLFILQCSLGCRQSDLRKLTAAHAASGVFEYIPAKTGKRSQRVVAVPLNRRAKAVIEGNPSVLRLAGHLGLSDYNTRIRAAAKAAGLDRPVCTYVRDKEQTLPLWRLLSSHAARRTFISTLLNAGVQERVIKDMDGHAADSKSFRRYYTIERETKEAAVKALE